MKIVLENIFMCLVTFWKCYFPPPPTQNPPPHNKKTTKTPPPTPPQQQQKKKIRDQREKVKNQNHTKTQIGSWVDQNHTKNQNHKERERSVRGFVARRLWVADEVESSGSWVRRSVGRRLWVEDRFVGS